MPTWIILIHRVEWNQHLKENVHFMWLAGINNPDHNTINRFRGDRLKDVLKTVFGQVVKLLVEAGHLDLKGIYTDGTKLEAQANRYTFVWGNAIKKNKARMAEHYKVSTALTFYDPSMVKYFSTQMEEIVGASVDLLFCTEEEAMIFTIMIRKAHWLQP